MPNLSDYDVLERAALDILVEAGVGFAKALQVRGFMDREQMQECLTDLLWTFASIGEGFHPTSPLPRQRVECRLGLFAPGSESAFEDPFVPDEQVWFSGHLALHEYVHEAVDRVMARFLPDAA